MPQVIISEEQAAQIMGFDEPYDLCDQTGRIWGRVTPVEPKVKLIEGDYSKLVIPFSDEEIEAARKEPASSIADLLARFRAAETGL